jgi:hypothetical protein
MDRRQRALRGVAASALAVFVAALFHVAGGGPEPGLLAIAVSVVLAAPASVLLAGRRSLWRLTLSVALSQFAFHFLFGLGQPSDVRFTGAQAMAGMPGMRLHVSGGTAAGLGGAAMWAGHAAAALLTIAAIRHGERMCARMLELATRFLVRAWRLVSAPAAAGRHAPVRRGAPAALAPQFLAGAVRHRGPPARFTL